MHDDRDARLRRLLRAQSLVSGLRQRPKRRRNPAPGETELGPARSSRSFSRATVGLLGRLLEQFVDPRLEHVAELLVERVAEIAAGAGGARLLRIGARAAGACRLRAGSRAAAAGARLLRGRFRAAAVAGARTRGRARAAAALAAAALAGGQLLLGAPAARGLAGIALGLGFRACLCFLAGRRRARLVVVVVARPGAGRGFDRLGGLFPIPVVGRGALLLLRLVLE